MSKTPGKPPTQPGLDLGDNVYEWENQCDDFDRPDGDSDSCSIRGGAWKKNGGELACESLNGDSRGSDNYDVGIRCCADP